MKNILLVGVGGFIGSVARYLVSSSILRSHPTDRFPVGTFAVNVAGCLVAGILGGLAIKNELFSHSTRLFLFVGLLGGFTTFSAFGLETIFLLRRGETLAAAGYILASVVASLGAAAVGLKLILRSEIL